MYHKGTHHICADDVRLTKKHAIFVWMPCVFNNRDDVRSFLGDIYQIPTTATWKLYCVDKTVLNTDTHTLLRFPDMTKCIKHIAYPTFIFSMLCLLNKLNYTGTVSSAVLTGPTMSDTWLTVVPLAAPRYKTLEPGFMWILSTPPRIAAANFERNGFQARYSNLFSPSWKRHARTYSDTDDIL